MEKVKITRMNGTYYTLYDCYGEIEQSKDLEHLKELYNTYNTDDELRNEMYGGADMMLRIEKELYHDGICVDSMVVVE